MEMLLTLSSKAEETKDFAPITTWYFSGGGEADIVELTLVIQ